MRVSVVALLLMLSGCGFHLQGSTPLPATLAEVQVDTSDRQSDFYFGLRKALMSAGTQVDDEDSRNTSDTQRAVIHILTDSAVQRTLTVSTLNVPTEYELTYKIKFSVTIQGKEVIAPEEHQLVRDYAYSENAQLAKERENAVLSQALAHDLVSVVMRRLASLSGGTSRS